MSTVIEQPKQQLTIRDRLKSPEMIKELAKALPKHCSPDRMARVALTALTRTPKLAQCDQASFFQCMLSLSQWGLEPDGRRAHLIPFENRKKNIVECQLIIDYKGYVELAYRSGFVESIHADVVREGDVFEYNLGEVVKHIPHFLRRDAGKPKEAGEVFAVYCRVALKAGATKTEVMSLQDIEGIRKRSKAASSGPWVTDWTEMAKKTVWRRTQKWLPLSAEILDAMEHDADKLETIEGVVTRVQTVDELSHLIASQAEDPINADGDDLDPIAEARAMMLAATEQKDVAEIARQTRKHHTLTEDQERLLEELTESHKARIRGE